MMTAKKWSKLPFPHSSRGCLGLLQYGRARHVQHKKKQARTLQATLDCIHYIACTLRLIHERPYSLDFSQPLGFANKTDGQLSKDQRTRRNQDDAPCPWPKIDHHQCASSLPRVYTTPSLSLGCSANRATRLTTMRLCSPTNTRPKYSRATRKPASPNWSIAYGPRHSRAMLRAL